MITESIQEVIFVGLPGPTHHYGGLSMDNVAAVSNKGSLSNPMQAALQALDLVKLLKSLGLEAAILPPQLRPHIGLLHQYFSGSEDEVIKQAAQYDMPILEKASSASAMWAANAATVAPSIDCSDRKLHITTANLHTNVHRRLEAEATYHTLQGIFKHVPDCEVHPPLFAKLRDEGAANHMRFSPGISAPGLHVFAYGDLDGRQDLDASKAIAAQHHIPAAQAVFIKQNPEVIRSGVFHNDVIAVSHEHVLLAHEHAYAENIGAIEKAYAVLHPGKHLVPVIIKESDLTVEEAVRSYFFNSQIITKPDGTMAVIAPVEVLDLYDGKAAQLMDKIRMDGNTPINQIEYVDLRQSMRNGGGPACLRLRVPMTAAQLAAIKNNVNVIANDKLLADVTSIIEKCYTSRLSSEDLGNPALYHQCKAMLEELRQLMKLPA
jgi:succinylarginine dihydrolase